MDQIRVDEQQVAVKHVRKSSSKKYAEAHTDFLKLVGQSDIKAIEKAVSDGLADDVVAKMAGSSHFMILGQLDMGKALPCLTASKLQAMQYLIGNPLIAETMVRHVHEVALYVPLRVLLLETEEGGTAFCFDLPSSLLGQFKNAEVDQVVAELDQLLLDLVEKTLG